MNSNPFFARFAHEKNEPPTEKQTVRPLTAKLATYIQDAQWPFRMLTECGWSVFRLRTPTCVGDENAKKPAKSWIERQTTLPNEETLAEEIEEYPDANWAIATGPVSNLVVVDCDTQYAVEWVKNYLPHTPLCVKTGKGWHYYYKYPTDEKKAAWLTAHRNYHRNQGKFTDENGNSVALKTGIDIQHKGQYVVAPGSIHPSGKRYELYEEYTCVWQKNLVPEFDFLGTIDTAEIHHLGKKKVYLGFNINEGNRNNALCSYIGALLYYGMRDKELKNEVLSYNKCFCLPPEDENVIIEKIKSLEKKHNQTKNYENNENNNSSSTKSNEKRIKIEKVPSKEYEDWVFTDNYLKAQFISLFCSNYRYDVDRDRWAAWDSKKQFWLLDKKTRIKSKLESFLAEQSETTEFNLSKSKRVFLQSYRCLSNIYNFLQSDSQLQIETGEWNTNPYLLGTPNGTLNLKTGELRKGVREEYINQITSISPAENANCPMWFKFLDQVCLGDNELVHYLKLICGYSLTGLTTQQNIYYLYGEGGNGKNVFLDTIMDILGDYAKKSSSSVFLEKKYEEHSTVIASFSGKRIVFASEIGSNKAWDEERIKSLSGGEKISARFMRKDEFEFLPQCKLFFAANDMPSLKSVGNSMITPLSNFLILNFGIFFAL